ncbi:hypothetical protein BZZ08_00848 [Streptomyces sp. MH60]|nr:hypothetical protein BZZ08_00848 [Streptomyces sp. MH60]
MTRYATREVFALVRPVPSMSPSQGCRDRRGSWAERQSWEAGGALNPPTAESFKPVWPQWLKPDRAHRPHHSGFRIETYCDRAHSNS